MNEIVKSKSLLDGFQGFNEDATVVASPFATWNRPH